MTHIPDRPVLAARMTHIPDRELVPGLVLFMDPSVLLHSDVFVCMGSTPVRGPHYFVMLDEYPGPGEILDDDSVWVPLLSGPSTGRLYIREDWKSGHPSFVERKSFIHPSQFWVASKSDVKRAAVIDRSMPGKRNRVDSTALDNISVAFRRVRASWRLWT